MRYDIKLKDCKICPKCKGSVLNWLALCTEEIAFYAVCSSCDEMFFANELSGFEVNDSNE